MIAKLSRLAPWRIVKFAATLKGVAGYTGKGAVRAETRSDGSRRIDADLSGIAGLKAEIVVKEAPVGALACCDGVVIGRLETAHGAPIPDLQAGDVIEIRQNGVTILKGVLALI
ncbi:MAG: hypothetical protein U5J99_10460 [Parvularculaceae bacterium]|nr:hypothetical protein [Parvularculaceae bacterium]